MAELTQSQNHGKNLLEETMKSVEHEVFLDETTVQNKGIVYELADYTEEDVSKMTTEQQERFFVCSVYIGLLKIPKCVVKSSACDSEYYKPIAGTETKDDKHDPDVYMALEQNLDERKAEGEPPMHHDNIKWIDILRPNSENVELNCVIIERYALDEEKLSETLAASKSPRVQKSLVSYAFLVLEKENITSIKHNNVKVLVTAEASYTIQQCEKFSPRQIANVKNVFELLLHQEELKYGESTELQGLISDLSKIEEKNARIHDYNPTPSPGAYENYVRRKLCIMTFEMNKCSPKFKAKKLEIEELSKSNQRLRDRLRSLELKLIELEKKRYHATRFAN